MNDWQVGQQVVVSDTQNRIREGVITKVAVKYVYVLWTRTSPARFDMVTGRCAEKRYDYGFGCQVYTRPQYEHIRRTEEVKVTLREVGIDLTYQAKFSLDQLEAILEIAQRDS